MEKKANHLVGSIICGILTAFGIVASIISLVGSGGGIWTVCDIVTLALFLLVGYYAIAGYKKPHGNLLKYIILAYAALSLFTVRAMVQSGNTWMLLVLVIRTGLLCFVAGRLVKVKENLVLMILVTVCEICIFCSDIKLANTTIGIVNGLIVWIDICVSYFLRYKEHKEAGLMDAPKAN